MIDKFQDEVSIYTILRTPAQYYKLLNIYWRKKTVTKTSKARSVLKNNFR